MQGEFGWGCLDGLLDKLRIKTDPFAFLLDLDAAGGFEQLSRLGVVEVHPDLTEDLE